MKRSLLDRIVPHVSFPPAGATSTHRFLRCGRLGLSLLVAGTFLAESRTGETRSRETRVESECRTAVTLSFRDTPLDEVLRSLHGITGMEVLIDDGARGTRISAQAENVSVIDALDSILESSGLNYAMVVDPRDPCRVQKLYVGQPGDFAGRAARPLVGDEGEDVAAVPSPGQAAGPRAAVGAPEPAPEARSRTPRPPGGGTVPSYPVPAGAPSAGAPPAGSPPVAAGETDSSPGQVADGVPAPEMLDTTSGMDEGASESSSATEPSGSGGEPETQPGTEPPEQDFSKPPAPDPMNLYRFFTGDNRTMLYHRLSCRDAMFTPAGAKMWFESEEQARAVGYAPHSCVSQALPR